MLRKLISAALRREMSRDDSRAFVMEDHPASEAGPHRGSGDVSAPDLDFPPMTPLPAPEAENDNPLRAYCAGVEADLRAAGYLR